MRLTRLFPRAVLFAALWLAGCVAVSTVQSRKQERPAAYEALTPEQRTDVDQGRIANGMTQDAVYIAWGHPDRITEGENETGRTVTWSYSGFYTRSYEVWGSRRPYFAYETVSYPRAHVTFVNGVVKEWQTHTAPGY